MIELSQIAADVLLESLQRSDVSPDRGLRIRQEHDNVMLDLDSPQEKDRVIKHNGAVVLIVDQDTEAEIGDARIDVEMSTEEPYVGIYRRSHKNS